MDNTRDRLPKLRKQIMEEKGDGEKVVTVTELLPDDCLPEISVNKMSVCTEHCLMARIQISESKHETSHPNQTNYPKQITEEEEDGESEA